jgi:hypothetical protein
MNQLIVKMEKQAKHLAATLEHRPATPEHLRSIIRYTKDFEMERKNIKHLVEINAISKESAAKLLALTKKLDKKSFMVLIWLTANEIENQFKLEQIDAWCERIDLV